MSLGYKGHNPKRDTNEPAIRAVLHQAKTQTWQLSDEGVPDLLCLTGHVLWLMEVKAAKGILTPAQMKFRDSMIAANAGYYVVTSPDEAMDALRMELARR